ncbi:hypothetical protein CNY89_13485 [Amaricoccus sp. HAR-UPW-R2A-40]|nr:hypothetical protein CNY89_13485 [Amaricoccus sp. HAR-UPW-R2A-40]
MDQLRRGFEHSLEFDRLENIRQIYAMEADAQAIATLYAWSERAAKPELWDAAGSIAHYEDIRTAFGDTLASTADLGLAGRAAFTAWYASDWRRESYYLSACSQYLDRLDAAHALQRYDPLPDGYFDDLCLLPDGTNYGCHLTPEIRGTWAIAD